MEEQNSSANNIPPENTPFQKILGMFLFAMGNQLDFEFGQFMTFSITLWEILHEMVYFPNRKNCQTVK